MAIFGLKMVILGLKMVQNGLFPKVFFVALIELLELIEMCFSKSGLAHFQSTYDILCLGEVII